MVRQRERVDLEKGRNGGAGGACRLFMCPADRQTPKVEQTGRKERHLPSTTTATAGSRKERQPASETLLPLSLARSGHAAATLNSEAVDLTRAFRHYCFSSFLSYEAEMNTIAPVNYSVHPHRHSVWAIRGRKKHFPKRAPSPTRRRK